jgi:hypothetical protein
MKPQLRFRAPKAQALNSHNHIDTITLSDGINGKLQRKDAILLAVWGGFCSGWM